MIGESASLWKKLRVHVRRSIEHVHDRMTVVSTGDGLISVRPVSGGDPYNIVKIKNASIAAGDDVVILRALGGEIALGSLSIPGVPDSDDEDVDPVSPFPQIVPYRFVSAAPLAVPNVSTYEPKLTELITLPEFGTWGCVFTASAICKRSVASGEKDMRLRIGGYTSLKSLRTADGLTMTNEHTMIADASRSADASPIVINPSNPTFNLIVDFRGVTTAGTTTLSNVEVNGFFYRIS